MILEFSINLLTFLVAVFCSIQVFLISEARIIAGLAAHNAARCVSVLADPSDPVGMEQIARQAAAVTLSGITPPNSAFFTSKLPKNMAGIIGGHVYRFREAYNRTRVDLREKIYTPSGKKKERIVKVTYHYPMIITMAARFFLKKSKDAGRYWKPGTRFPFYMKITAYDVTRFNLTK